MFYGNASEQMGDRISRDIMFPQPVVTDNFQLIVKKAAPSVLMKIDLIGMPPGKKYEADPVLEPKPYEDGTGYY